MNKIISLLIKNGILSALTIFFLLSVLSLTLTNTPYKSYQKKAVMGVQTQKSNTLATVVDPDTITPYCLGGNPCTSPNPSDPFAPTSTTTGSPTGFESPTTAPAVTQTEDPCETDQASTQNTSKKKRVKNYYSYTKSAGQKNTYSNNDTEIQTDWERGKKRNWENRENGNISELFRMLIELLERLLALLGIENPNLNPNENEPEDPQTPDNPDSPDVEDPCDPISPTNDPDPTLGDGAPTTIPNNQPETSSAPTDIQIAPSTYQSNPSLAPTAPANNNGNETGGGEQRTVKITFYGSYDNDPKGSLAISDPVIHQEAGGIGTFEDPLSFASPDGDGAYEVGAKIYVPMVQKYFIKEDTCAVSWTAPDGCGDVDMVDLYVGNPSSDEAVVECENALTPSGDTQIILNPPSGLTYDPTPIWNQNTGACMTPHN